MKYIFVYYIIPRYHVFDRHALTIRNKNWLFLCNLKY